ncbi:hypothetical protein ACWPKS_12595 [Coraliomargarita sp. W4R72]
MSSYLVHWLALSQRELATVLASRVIWVFGFACLCFGLLIVSGSAGEGSTAVWLSLPLVLYALPLIGLLAGVAAAQGDAMEEPLIASRIPRVGQRMLVKWLLWSLLLGLVALMWLLPAAARAGQWQALPQLWAYALGEVAVFLAAGLLLGHWIRDSVAAHLSALLLGFFALTGAGIFAWVAADWPYLQAHPSLWTLSLMLHPVEALRVGLLFSIDDLPFDPGELPTLAAWWLRHPGVWYACLSLTLSGAALSLVSVRRRYFD